MINDEYKARVERLKRIQERYNPYPSRVERTHTVKEVLVGFDFIHGSTLSLCGRVRLIREHGGSLFFDVCDESGKIQGYAKRDHTEDFDFLKKNLDIGDFLEIRGEPYVTQRGEKSILVHSARFISKSLLPLPEKFHGLEDDENRLRKRYLDILTHPEVKDLFLKRSKFWNAMRFFLLSKGFMEVETPVLETTTGGADARPFRTHHNALDLDVFLRISAGELWQKRLMVAGYEKTFEIGRIFRNEGMDAEHLQDYTQMEYYWAYANWEDGMRLTEELIKHVAQETFGTLTFTIKHFDVDLGRPWERYDYRQEILKRTGVDIELANVDSIKEKLAELRVKYDDFNNLERGIDQLWKYCRKQIAGPGYLVYPPKAISPLAKESETRPGYVERFQFILAGSELCNGYSELNDPIDQEDRFGHQAELRAKGDEEAQMNDTDFVEALNYGMPPTCGLGISERLFSFLANLPLREGQIFPLMRPEGRQ